MPALFIGGNMFSLGFIVGYFFGVAVILLYLFIFGGKK